MIGNSKLNKKVFTQLFAYVLIWLSMVAVMTVISLIRTGRPRMNLRVTEIEALLDWRNLAIFGTAILVLVAIFTIVHRSLPGKLHKRVASTFTNVVLDELGSALFNAACGLAVGVVYVGMRDVYLLPALMLLILGYWFKPKY
jgi:hypothetical protein